MRICTVCLGKGALIPPNDEAGGPLTCFACVGAKVVEDPEFDALVEKVAVLRNAVERLTGRVEQIEMLPKESRQARAHRENTWFAP